MLHIYGEKQQIKTIKLLLFIFYSRIFWLLLTLSGEINMAQLQRHEEHIKQ